MKSLLSKAFSKRVLFVSLAHFLLYLLSSNVCLAESAPLNTPNNLISFTADCQSYYAHIKWSTASETKKGYFVIERTNDGVHFQTITMVQNSFENTPTNETHEYSFKDESPLLGVSYYRISEVDSVENKKMYINTIVYTPCENDETIDAVVDENQVTVSVNALTNDPNVCNISIINDHDKAVLSHTKKISVGMNSYKVDTHLQEGLYNLKVSYRNNKSFSKSFKVNNTH